MVLGGTHQFFQHSAGEAGSSEVQGHLGYFTSLKFSCAKDTVSKQ